MSVPSEAGSGLRKLENLVTFGDSWTDSGRMSYFIAHKGEAPPAGVPVPEIKATASGGLAWGQFVAKATGAAYQNYGISGATVSNKIVSRYFDLIGQDFPSILEYQIPAFEADIASGTLYENRAADNTVYAIWIGTNDLGENAMLTNDNAPGTTLTSFVEGVWKTIDHVHAAGGRHIVLLNAAPLELAPLYKASFPGPNKPTPKIAAEIENKILQFTSSVNTMFEYGVPFQLLIQKRWPGASISIFDTNTLLRDIFNNPADYLEAPADSSGIYNVWDPVAGVDNKSTLPLASFMWHDPLHPAERTCMCGPMWPRVRVGY
jgi:phospholipase/lecithinase/hemolysin